MSHYSLIIIPHPDPQTGSSHNLRGKRLQNHLFSFKNSLLIHPSHPMTFPLISVPLRYSSSVIKDNSLYYIPINDTSFELKAGSIF